LNKALYFIDNISYLKTGKAISDFKYVKQAYGPTPEPSMLLSIRDQLVASGDIDVSESEFFGRIQKRLVAKRQPTVSFFSVEEIIIIDDVVASIQHLNGSEISDISHQFPAWKAAADREELPFFTFLLSSKPPMETDIEWAKTEIRRVQS
jgi:hypothetical protein